MPPPGQRHSHSLWTCKEWAIATWTLLPCVLILISYRYISQEAGQSICCACVYYLLGSVAHDISICWQSHKRKDHICGGQGPWYILTRNSCQVCMEVEATCNPWDISSSLSINFFQECSINLLSVWYSNFQVCEYTRFLSLQFSYMLVALQIFETKFQWLNDQSQAADQPF